MFCMPVKSTGKDVNNCLEIAGWACQNAITMQEYFDNSTVNSISNDFVWRIYSVCSQNPSCFGRLLVL